MAISVNCASCGRKYVLKDELAGKCGKCSECGAKLQVPALSDESPVSDAVEAPIGNKELPDSLVRWEYKHYWPAEEANLSIEQVMAHLNKLGAEGWEIISVCAHMGIWVNYACYILKRPL